MVPSKTAAIHVRNLVSSLSTPTGAGEHVSRKYFDSANLLAASLAVSFPAESELERIATTAPRSLLSPEVHAFVLYKQAGYSNC